MIIELAATTLDDALTAERAGADRLLLASSLVEGGLTPSIGLIVTVTSKVALPVSVVLRPHSAGFVYSARDMDVLEADMCAFTQTGANAAVIGMLDKHGNVDFRQLERLLSRVRNKDVVFDRAIDEAADITEAARNISKYDEITSIVTSGGKGAFPERMARIRSIQEAAPELEIIVAGDVGVNNLADIAMLAQVSSCRIDTAARLKRSAVLGVDFRAAVELVRFARAM